MTSRQVDAAYQAVDDMEDGSDFLLLRDFIGQNSIKENLQIFIDTAKKRHEVLDHILFYGPSGLGKKMLANILANEMGGHLISTGARLIKRAEDLVVLMSTMEAGDILLIDEIHRLSKQAEEILYPAMEDYCLDIVVKDGAAVKTIRLPLPPFTVVGITERIEYLSSELLDHFGVVLRFEYYAPEELSEMILLRARRIGVGIEPEAAYEIALSSKGKPRTSLLLLHRIRDFAQIYNDNFISLDLTKKALDLINAENYQL